MLKFIFSVFPLAPLSMKACWKAWCYDSPLHTPENITERRCGKGTWPQKTCTWYSMWQSWNRIWDQGYGKLLHGAWWGGFGAGNWTIGMLIVAGHMSDVAYLVAVIWLLWLDPWCVIYDSYLISDMCCLRLMVEYLKAVPLSLISCFTLYMVLISPCGLIDTYYWLIRLVFHIRAQFEYVSLSYIYWYDSTVYFPA